MPWHRGRGSGRPKVDVALEHKAQKQLKKGVGILKVAKTLGLGTGTVQRIKQEIEPVLSPTPRRHSRAGAATWLAPSNGAGRGDRWR